ncbi:MAG TPA: HAD family hydrolase [Acidobacteriaceae bacterium]|jgi:hypothetical protein
MNAPRLIAIDMDGTLLGSNGQVSTRNLEALRKAEAAGIEIVIATGRRHAYAMRVLRGLGLHATHAMVSSNGTVLRTLGSELLHRRHMQASTARWLCEYVKDFRSTLVMTFDKVGSDGNESRGAMVVESLDALRESINRWVEANAASIEPVSPVENALENDLPIQMMLCGTMQRMGEAEARLLEDPRIHDARRGETPTGAEITLHRTEYPSRNLCILDILPAGVSKASALQCLMELRGLEADDVLAIGDNWNDLPMLELAGHAVLMSNAPGPLKELAGDRGWTIGPSHDEDGVAVAIEGVLAAAGIVPVSA